MLQLDVVGTFGTAALGIIATQLQFPVEAATLWIVVSAFIYVRVCNRLERMAALDRLQDRINRLGGVQ